VKLRVLDDAEAVARAAADVVAEAVARRPRLVLALPTGQTPLPLYDELAARHARRALDLTQARAFTLDELSLPPDDPRTFRAFMRRHVWGRTGIDPRRFHVPDGVASDLEAECQRYEEALIASGGLDLAILGLGVDGHVAYNLPGPAVMGTHVVRLPESLASGHGVPPEEGPLHAVTMGLGTLRAARSVLVVATGGSKCLAVRALVQGPALEDWPCSFLSNHPGLELLVDRMAAAALPQPPVEGSLGS
jgi:glucosamine-6-phosphate deaminase